MIGNLVASNPFLFNVDFESCNVRLGDFVTPRTVIGWDVEDGDLVQAGCYGTVRAVQFTGGSAEITMLVQPENRLVGRLARIL